jgi:hypothetical protein
MSVNPDDRMPLEPADSATARGVARACAGMDMRPGIGRAWVGPGGGQAHEGPQHSIGSVAEQPELPRRHDAGRWWRDACPGRGGSGSTPARAQGCPGSGGAAMPARDAMAGDGAGARRCRLLSR